MFGWNGFLAHYVDNNSAMHRAMTLALDAGTLIVAVACLKGKWEPQKPRFLLQCGVLLGASLLTNPHLYMQDLSLVALMAALGVAYALRTGARLISGGTGLLAWLAQLWDLRILDDGDQRDADDRLVWQELCTLGSKPAARLPFRQERPAEVNLALLCNCMSGLPSPAPYVDVPHAGRHLPVAATRLRLGKRRGEFVRDLRRLFCCCSTTRCGRRRPIRGVRRLSIAADGLLFFGHVRRRACSAGSSTSTLHWYDSQRRCCTRRLVVPLLFAALISSSVEQYWRFMARCCSIVCRVHHLRARADGPAVVGKRQRLLDGVHIIPFRRIRRSYDNVSPNAVHRCLAARRLSVAILPVRLSIVGSAAGRLSSSGGVFFPSSTLGTTTSSTSSPRGLRQRRIRARLRSVSER
jgi:hypothetical protein